MASCDTDYTIGTDVIVEATFKDDADALTDPTTVTCYALDPSGNEAAVTPLSNPSVGVYRGTVTVDESGIWRYRFKGEGVVNIASEGRFHVERTPFTTL